jgi:hypothetical protein
MNALSVLTLMLALTAAHQVLGPKVNCVIEKDKLVFDYTQLSNKDQDYVLTAASPDKEGNDRSLTFNFCRNLVE